MRQATGFVLMMLLITSCVKDLSSQSDNYDEFSESYKETLTKSIQDDETMAYEILKDGYVEFVDNTYKVAISLIDAIELGYSQGGYMFLCNRIAEANEIISKKIAEIDEGTYSIEDCTYDSTVEMPVYNTRAAMGTIEATLGSPGSESFFAPIGMQGVQGQCFNRTALLAFNLIESNFTGGKLMKSRFGNGELSVGIATSNVYGTLMYTTSDSNGGIYSWKGYPEQ